MSAGAPPLQLGFLIEMPPLLGPILVGVGCAILLLQYLHTYHLPNLPASSRTDYHRQARIVAPTVLGILLLVLGMLVRYQTVWAFIVVLFAIGRAIEGAVTVRTYRRILYYLSQILAALTLRRSAGTDGNTGGFVSYVLRRIAYQSIAFLVIMGGITFATITVSVTASPVTYALPVIWATLISTTTIFVFLWDVRSVLDHIDPILVVGLLFCVLGAELHDFTNITTPIPVSIQRTILAPVITFVAKLLPGGLPVFEVVAYLVGWIAYGCGIAFSLLILLTE